jgi:hypothetical protein
VPVSWTDVVPADAYTSVGGGRSRFRVEDLMALADPSFETEPMMTTAMCHVNYVHNVMVIMYMVQSGTASACQRGLLNSGNRNSVLQAYSTRKSPLHGSLRLRPNPAAQSCIRDTFRGKSLNPTRRNCSPMRTATVRTGAGAPLGKARLCCKLWPSVACVVYV